MVNVVVKRNDRSFTAGMFLLETLTAGMYNDPLSIYREYIQNAVDSLDLRMASPTNEELKVEINLDPYEQTVSIRDNGVGIPGTIAESILSSIGSSNKLGSDARGFRGIGRLGGIAFSDRAIFRTKASQDNFESVQEWNCRRLRELLADRPKASLTLNEVFNEVTKFERINSKKARDSYFEVILEGVSSFRNLITDISKVSDYLSQVAPVPFNPVEFKHHQEINNFLRSHLKRYGQYSIILNGDLLYKPYQDKIRLTKKGYDTIEKVECIEINIRDKVAAYCWVGERKDLSGSITKSDHSSGIRVRIGNILLGDTHLLDRCFREPRFNSYCIGEVHIESPELIPNSRRDDLVDNDMKTLFFDAIERKIGLPFSKEIRRRSRITSNNKFSNGEDSVKTIDFDKKLDTTNITNISKPDNSSQALKIIDLIRSKCINCPNAIDIFSEVGVIESNHGEEGGSVRNLV